jgi:hypothetical protein
MRKKFERVLLRALEKALDYSDAFKNVGSIVVFKEIPEQDEEIRVEIMRNGQTMSYSYINSSRTRYKAKLGFIAKELKQYGVTPEIFASHFKKALGEKIAGYLADRELVGLEKELIS